MPDFSDILKAIDKAIEKFNSKIPAAQKRAYEGIAEELKRLDTVSGKIKSTVNNLRIIQSIKNKLTRLIVTPEYIEDVKEFAKQFNEITKLQNEYWKSVEETFKPRPLLREIRKQAIADTIKNLTESGIAATVSDPVAGILRTNITTGGSYAQLTEQLREKMLTTNTDGALEKYAKQITVDSLNQYSAQYTQTVSSDLGLEWYAWQGSEIMTSRPFCQAMVENNRYFHISQVPNLLKGLDAQGNKLKYEDNKTNKEKTVGLYDKTGLPHGFIAGTNVANFFINRGGHGCGHQPRPVSERIVPIVTREIVYATAEYKRWKGEDIVIKDTSLPEKQQIAQKPIAPESSTPNQIAKQAKELNMAALLDPQESFANLIKQNRPAYEEKQKEFPGLSVEEIVAADMYANTTYRQLNGHLRNPEYSLESQKDYYDNLDILLRQTLDKLPNFEGSVYRGADLDRVTFENYEKAFKSGKPILEKAFMSTSRDENAAFDKNAFFVVKSKSGKNIERLVDDLEEKEVLFKSGTRFKITEMRSQVISGKKRTLIKMEEL